MEHTFVLCRCIGNYHEWDKGIQNQPLGLGVLPTVRRLRSRPCIVEFNKEVCINTEKKNKRCVTLSRG